MTKLSYETCVKLKEAGFSQRLELFHRGALFTDFGWHLLKEGIAVCELGGRIAMLRDGEVIFAPLDKVDFVMGDLVYRPTLGELIEACGDDFYRLVRAYSGEFSAEMLGGEACLSETQEEAVAALYLELRKENPSACKDCLERIGIGKTFAREVLCEECQKKLTS